MQKIGIIGHAWAGLAGLLDRLGTTATVYRGAPGGRGANKRPVRYYASARPTDARWWHDLEQPGQCARLQAAKDKRERRADKLQACANQLWNNNYAHHNAFKTLVQGYIQPLNLNPFYVAK